jgi:hypothetical protein
MTKSLGQAYSIQTFDQQQYAIAKQVEWAKQDTFSKLWGDGGLKDLLIESSVYAAGSVEQMMTGKQFNRAVRALTLVYEATRILCSIKHLQLAVVLLGNICLML